MNFVRNLAFGGIGICENCWNTSLSEIHFRVRKTHRAALYETGC